MRIGVTGASGFVGRHVLVELARRQIETVAATRDAGRLNDWQSRVRVVEVDIGGASSRQLEELAACDALIHLAWAGLPNYQSRHHFEEELPRQYGFLKKLIERGLPSLIVSGTCLEYGLQSGALSENDPTDPITSYGLAKDTLRRQLEVVAKCHKLAMTWARLFYTYGEGQPASSLYSQLRDAVQRGAGRFAMSAGEQLRDYLSVGEVARLIVELTMRGADFGLVNVCSGRPISVRRLVEGWMEENGWDLQLELGRQPYPAYEPMAFWGSRDKLDRFLTGP